MVQKNGKYGIRSGNTLRAINTKHFRKYRREACLVWRTTRATTSEAGQYNLHPGANLPCSDVLFSLNKQNRWLLPEYIKELLGLIEERFSYSKEERNEFLWRYFWSTKEFKELDRFDEAIELVERYKLLKNSCCFNIRTSPTKDHNGLVIKRGIVKQKQRGFCDADNVLKTYPLHSRRTRRRCFLSQYEDISEFEQQETALNALDRLKECNLDYVKDDVDVETNEKCSIRLEVLYPCENTNVLSLKPKLLGYDTNKYFKSKNHIRKPWTAKRHSLRRSRKDTIKYQISNSQTEIKTTESECYTHDNIYDSDKEINEEIHRKPLLLFDFIFEAFKTRNITLSDNNIKAHTTIKTSVKDVTIPGDNQNKEDVTESKSFVNNPLATIQSSLQEVNIADEPNKKSKSKSFVESPVLVPSADVDINIASNNSSVTILLPTEEVTPRVLSDSFSREYIECNCFPRRFLINISKFVSNLDGIGSALKLIRLKKLIHCWLVFAHVPNHPLQTQTAHAYEVSLNVNATTDTPITKLDNIDENSLLHINDIIAKTLSHMKTLPMDCLITETSHKRTKAAIPSNCTSLLEEVNEWSSISYSPDITGMINELFEDIHEEFDTPNPSRSLNKNNQIKFCNICCSETQDCLTLSACDNFFCLGCWKSYIENSLKSIDVKVQCPQNGCNAEVNTGTLLSLVNIKDVITYLTRCNNVMVELNTCKQWCTNEECGRIIEVNSPRSKIGRCSCGETRCMSCPGKPHWPLSCQCHLEYVAKLVDTHDKDMVPNDFVMKYDCKYCRICFKIMKRYDKCSIRFCNCGGKLCQRCSLMFHSKGNDLYKGDSLLENMTNTYKKTYVTQKETLGSNRTEWYKLALKHRLLQHPYRVAKIHASAKLMATRLSHFILREERKCRFIYLDFESTGNYFTESDKVGKYLEHVVDLYCDVNRCVECVVEYLDCEGIVPEQSSSLHRQAMALSTCANNIFELCKDGALMNSKSILVKLSKNRSEIRRLMEEIVANSHKMGLS